MATTPTPHKDTKDPLFCPACANTKNQPARHNHFLSYAGDLAEHLRHQKLPDDQVAAILAWVRSMSYLYGRPGEQTDIRAAREAAHEERTASED